MDAKNHSREIQNIIGKYRAVRKRQDGQCYYCGKRILQDQPRTIVPLDLSHSPSVRNSAYIHEMCKLNELEIIRTDDDISYLREDDVAKILTDIETERLSIPTCLLKGTLPDNVRFELERHFQYIVEKYDLKRLGSESRRFTVLDVTKPSPFKYERRFLSISSEQLHLSLLEMFFVQIV